jgi:uncharacterized membrane protein YeiB
MFVAHVIIGTGLLESIGRLEDQAIGYSLFSALAFCICAIFFSVIRLKCFKVGPLEWGFRKVAN